MDRKNTFNLGIADLERHANLDEVRHELGFRRNRGRVKKLAAKLGVVAGTQRGGIEHPPEVVEDHATPPPAVVEAPEVAQVEPITESPDCQPPERAGLGDAQPCRPCDGRGGFASGLECRTCEGTGWSMGVAPKWRYTLPSFVTAALKH
jgi:hypothetical protein